jgi:enamine deaminase RidA (YjgF/YER057c/UK114 family)
VAGGTANDPGGVVVSDRRRSIDIESFRHSNPIPAASRIGPLLASSVITPRFPHSTEVPDDIVTQVENLFAHIGEILAAAGAGWEHVIKLEFTVPSLDDRAVINGPYLERFPDAASRPARHTSVGTAQAQCSFWAYVPD